MVQRCNEIRHHRTHGNTLQRRRVREKIYRLRPTHPLQRSATLCRGAGDGNKYTDLDRLPIRSAAGVPNDGNAPHTVSPTTHWNKESTGTHGISWNSVGISASECETTTMERTTLSNFMPNNHWNGERKEQRCNEIRHHRVRCTGCHGTLDAFKFHAKQPLERRTNGTTMQ